MTLLGEGDPVVLASGLPAAGGLQVHDGALYVSDRTLGQILIVARDGTALGTPEVIASDLSGPEGFLVTENAIVVVEAEAGRVIKIDANGDRQELAAIPPGAPGAAGMPPSQVFNGIAMDEDGNLFVTGEAARVLYRINAPW